MHDDRIAFRILRHLRVAVVQDRSQVVVTYSESDSCSKPSRDDVLIADIAFIPHAPRKQRVYSGLYTIPYKSWSMECHSITGKDAES